MTFNVSVADGIQLKCIKDFFFIVTVTFQHSNFLLKQLLTKLLL